MKVHCSFQNRFFRDLENKKSKYLPRFLSTLRHKPDIFPGRWGELNPWLFENYIFWSGSKSVVIKDANYINNSMFKISKNSYCVLFNIAVILMRNLLKPLQRGNWKGFGIYRQNHGVSLWISLSHMLISHPSVVIKGIQKPDVNNIKELWISLIARRKIFDNFCMPQVTKTTAVYASNFH